MPHFVGEEAGMDAHKRERDERQRVHGQARSSKQGGVRARVASQDERSIHDVSRRRGPEAAGIRQLREQHAPQAIAVRPSSLHRDIRFNSGFHDVDLPKSSGRPWKRWIPDAVGLRAGVFIGLEYRGTRHRDVTAGVTRRSPFSRAAQV